MIILYLRLSYYTHKLMRIASWITFAVINIAGLVLTFLNVFQCIPVSDAFASDGRCIPLIKLYLASAPVNIITDIAVLVLPIPALTSMHLPRKQKTILIATFGLWIYVIATDIIRIHYLQQSSEGGSNATTSYALGDEVDFPWYASLSFMWSVVEVNVGIICACIPTIRPLVSKIMPTLIDNHRWTSFLGCRTQTKSSSTTAPTAVSSPRSAEVNGQRMDILSPIAHPTPALTTNTESLFVPDGRLSSSAIELSHIDHAQLSVTGEVIPSPQDVEIGIRGVNSPPYSGVDPERTTRAPRSLARSSRTEPKILFDFFRMKRPKSMLRTSVEDSIKYCFIVAVLFFLCGLSHGLWNNLHDQIAKISLNSMARTLGLYSSYWGVYFCGPPTVGQYVLRRAGFKVTFITGVCISATGIVMFWPSTVLVSYPGFLVSNFFVGFGFSVIETATNAFVFLCGPAYYGEIRLLIAQAIEAGGKMVGMLIDAKHLFQDVQPGPTLLHFEWLYLAMALSEFLLALTIYYLPLPEVTDDELQLQLRPEPPQLNHMVTAELEQELRIGTFRVIFVTLTLGFCTLFLYSGVQEANSLWFNNILGTLELQSKGSQLSLTADNYGIIATASGAVGMLVSAAFCFLTPPRILLLFSFLGAFLLSVLIFTLTGIDAYTMAALLIILHFFEGPILPLTYGTSLRKMGRWTKIAAAALTSAAGGAAVVPWMVYAIIKVDGETAQKSYSLLIAFFAVGTLFPIYLSAFSAARQQVHRGKKSDRFGGNGSPRSPPYYTRGALQG
jgi:fucose permease